MAESQSRPDLTRSQLFPLIVDRDKARFGAWYQMMPRSQSQVAGQHGTLRDCIARVPDIAAMGFDVLYFTPIHPIGRIRRKGRNNARYRGRRRSRLALCDRRGRGRPRCAASRTRHDRGFSRAGRGLPRIRPRTRARLRRAMLARPSLADSSIRNGSSGGPDRSVRTAETAQ